MAVERKLLDDAEFQPKVPLVRWGGKFSTEGPDSRVRTCFEGCFSGDSACWFARHDISIAIQVQPVSRVPVLFLRMRCEPNKTFVLVAVEA